MSRDTPDFVDKHSLGVIIHALALRVAKQAREAIPTPPEIAEYAATERRLYQIARANLEELRAALIRKRHISETLNQLN